MILIVLIDRYRVHKDTKTIYDPNDFDINGNNKYTNDKYDPKCFDRYDIHKILKVYVILKILI